MFDNFWKTLTGTFDKIWLATIFGPALIFWGTGGGIWLKLAGPAAMLKLWQGYATEMKVLLGVGGLLVVYFSAMLLDAFSRGLLRFFEGYWPRRLRMRKRRARRLAQKQQRLSDLRVQLIEGKTNSRTRTELARLNAELTHRPENPEDSMPTRLGDIIRTAEDYPRLRYGLDPIIFWPRLSPLLSPELSESMAAVQSQLDLLLRLATLTFFYVVISTVVVALKARWNLLWFTLTPLPLSLMFWQSAHAAAVNYGGLLCSAFDLCRLEVYEKMRWPLPKSPKKEKAHGETFIRFLASGIKPETIKYAKSATQSSTDTAAEK